jgi:crossover junction endodeoxyribonuclease RuvC
MKPLTPFVAGIDPGITGAFAFLALDSNEMFLFDIPVIDNTVDGASMARLIRQHSPVLTILERASARPMQGLTSTFTFGRVFGTLEGVLEATNSPFFLVHPRTWKKAYKLTDDKDMSRQAAARLFPNDTNFFQRKSDHNHAEAALLAHYAKNYAMKQKPEEAE